MATQKIIREVTPGNLAEALRQVEQALNWRLINLNLPDEVIYSELQEASRHEVLMSATILLISISISELDLLEHPVPDIIGALYIPPEQIFQSEECGVLAQYLGSTLQIRRAKNTETVVILGVGQNVQVAAEALLSVAKKAVRVTSPDGFNFSGLEVSDWVRVESVGYSITFGLSPQSVLEPKKS